MTDSGASGRFELWLDLDPLREPAYTAIAELTRFVAYATLREGPTGGLSPIWYLDGDSGSLARVEQGWPPEYRQLYWSGPAAEALGASTTVEAIVDAVARHRAEPVALVQRVRGTSALWAADSSPVRTARPYVPPAHVLSRLLAHVGHGAAAGLSLDELRASLGADADADRASRAESKLTAFEDTVDAWWKDAP